MLVIGGETKLSGFANVQVDYSEKWRGFFLSVSSEESVAQVFISEQASPVQLAALLKQLAKRLTGKEPQESLPTIEWKLKHRSPLTPAVRRRLKQQLLRIEQRFKHRLNQLTRSLLTPPRAPSQRKRRGPSVRLKQSS